MQIALQCRHCAHTWTLHSEPRLLLQLCCPGCKRALPPIAAEELASSLEDALCQLAQLGSVVQLRVEMDSKALPEAFLPEASAAAEAPAGPPGAPAQGPPTAS